MQVVHISACSVALQVKFKTGITCILEAAKAAETCGSVRDVNEGID